jgi:hypothetical protein
VPCLPLAYVAASPWHHEIPGPRRLFGSVLPFRPRRVTFMASGRGGATGRALRPLH